MAESIAWEEIAKFTKSSAERGTEAVEWASALSNILRDSGETIPSIGLAKTLISHVCGVGYTSPASWIYVEWAISSGLVPPVLAIAHLSVRIPPCRRIKAVGYAIYLEILMRHILKFAPDENRSLWRRILLSVDGLLHLSEAFGISSSEPGVIVVEFVFYILWQLVDAALDDEDLLERCPEKKSYWLQIPEKMDIDGEDALEGQDAFSEKSRRPNTVASIELLGILLQQKLICGLLSLARQNMPSHWRMFTNRLQLLVTNSSAMRSASVSPTIFLNLTLHIQEEFNGSANKCTQFEELQAFTSLGGLSHGASHSSLWIPLDIYLEDCLDFSVAATNAIEIIRSLVKALQAINRTTWHEAFLGLWVAALRLVQRDRDPIEGPFPRLDTRFCILLSISTLAVADIIREEEVSIAENRLKDGIPGERREALMSSIRAVGEYESLLSPPQGFISEANQAAAKAMLFISEFNISRGHAENMGPKEKTFDCTGNMRHLIVEACIARNLLDTSVYFWPGYVTGRISQQSHAMPNQPGWPALMKGAPLVPSMINALIKTPASSLGELEKIFQIASNGSDNDRISASAILCGASLLRGWNFQEYTVRFVVRLLAPPVPRDYSDSDSHLIKHAPVMYVILAAISPVDCVQVFSFHGLVPELAGALMAICEVFGSRFPTTSWSLPTGEEINTHAVFSNAFILLLRLWKFNHPPLEYCIMGDGAPVGSQLTPDYLLLLRNSYVLASSRKHSKGKPLLPNATDTCPIFLDSFPKLKTWYMQHQACLASTLSGLVPGTPVHHNVDSLLSMMFRKLARGGQPAVAGVSGSGSLSNSSASMSEDHILSRPKLTAWDIMEAVPFVVDAALTACSHSQLSPRELATGLKDLADFLPASLATIVSYFSAEVTRGVWEPAYMNGTDWPSPAANLSTVEDNIKKIVAATGVDVPSLVTAGSSKAKLPLPLAAFVSLTITYKLDPASVRFLDLAGPALENLAASCPWPSMPIVAALWIQKVKRWTDFLTFSASRTVFIHNHEAVAQLLRSCFNAALAFQSGASPGGVGSLLGHGFGSHCCGGLSPVAPGILYLRIYRCIKDILRLTQQILSLLIEMVELAATRAGLSAAAARASVASSVAAAFAWITGGARVVQSLFQEMLPSWFLTARHSTGATVLVGHGLARFAVLCGVLAWGGPGGPASEAARKRRARVVRAHLDFIVNAMDGNVSLGCGSALWRAYVVGFLGIVVECAPSWIADVESRLLRRLGSALRRWNEPELAFAVLFHGGVPAMGVAAEHLFALYG